MVERSLPLPEPHAGVVSIATIHHGRSHAINLWCTTLLIQLSWPTTTLQHRPDIGHFSTTVWDMHRTLRDARVSVPNRRNESSLSLAATSS